MAATIKGNVGKVGKISNFGAIGDGSDNGNVGKVGKIGNFGAVGNGRWNTCKAARLWTLPRPVRLLYGWGCIQGRSLGGP